MTFLVTNYVLFTLSPLIHSSLITKFTRKKIEWFSIYQRENEQKKSIFVLLLSENVHQKDNETGKSL
jgi:hypothetical protein